MSESTTPSAAVSMKPRERDTLVQALRAGVVPQTGLQHLQVGRAGEVREMVRDIDRIASGGAAVRFVIADYGSGKTFLLKLARSVAMQKRLVTVHADLSPDRRIHATGGQARSLYSELMRNMSTRARPDGGALGSVVERFVGEAQAEAASSGRAVASVIRDLLSGVRDLVSGHDFATVIQRYQEADAGGDQSLKDSALRWLRAEFATRTEARRALGLDAVSIIEDATVHDYLKVMSRFCVLAGYAGLLVCLDEMVNLYKLTNAQARTSNYEQVLRIVNDMLQGSVENLGFFMGGTVEFLEHPRRGLYSYEALRSRLAGNGYARDGLVDLSGPVIRLQTLTPEELYVLLDKLRHVFAGGDASRHLVPDEAFEAFMTHCGSTIGDAYFRTPRNTIKAFLDMLAVLEQNPGTDWRTLVSATRIEADAGAGPAGEPDDDAPAPAPATASTATAARPATGAAADDDLASFRL